MFANQHTVCIPANIRLPIFAATVCKYIAINVCIIFQIIWDLNLNEGHNNETFTGPRQPQRPTQYLEVGMYYVMSLVTCTTANLDSRSSPKGRVRKNETGKNVVFWTTGGGRVSDGSKMRKSYFGNVFSRLACRIMLGPKKQVLNLVWCCLNT